MHTDMKYRPPLVRQAKADEGEIQQAMKLMRLDYQAARNHVLCRNSLLELGIGLQALKRGMR